MDDNRSMALVEADEKKDMLNKILASEKNLNLFVEKMALNQKFKTEKPNTHRFFFSLHNYRSVHGKMTDNQKAAIVREIRKYADYFLTLRVARPASQ